ncbi:MAG: hypothetical protein Q9219_001563 [cf. Caloplaca sp. 3 TL-2023]
MVKPAFTAPTPQFPAHAEPRVWFLSSGSSPIGISLSRQLLAHGDCVVYGTTVCELSDTASYRAAEFSTFWTEEVLVKAGWKDRARAIELDGRCESLAYEIAPFNIKMTIVQPNIEINVLTNQITAAAQLPQYRPGNNPAPLFREIIGGILDRLGSTSQLSTDDASDEPVGSVSTLQAEQIVSIYPQLSEQSKNRLLTETINALTAIGGHDNPPARHIVGHEAVGLVKEKLKTVSEELEEFVEVSCAVDLDGEVPSSQQSMAS